MADRADGAVAVTREKSTGKVGFIRVKGDGDLLPGAEGDTARRRERQGRRLPRPVRRRLRRAPGRARPARASRSRPPAGPSPTTQSYQGVDVFGSMLQAPGRQGRRPDRRSTATPRPTSSLSVDPRLTAAEAGKRAVGLVQRRTRRADDGEKADLTGIAAKATELVVYRMGATQGEAGDAVLAYQVEVTNEQATSATSSFIDAHDRQAAQPLVDGPRRPRPRALRGRQPARPRLTEVWRRATRSPARSTSTSRTWSTPPVSPTGSSRTPSVATPTTATGATMTHGQQRPAASAAPTPTGTASPPTTATVSPPTTSSRTSGATPTPSTPPA